jgi:hypothetical protein
MHCVRYSSLSAFDARGDSVFVLICHLVPCSLESIVGRHRLLSFRFTVWTGATAELVLQTITADDRRFLGIRVSGLARPSSATYWLINNAVLA